MDLQVGSLPRTQAEMQHLEAAAAKGNGLASCEALLSVARVVAYLMVPSSSYSYRVVYLRYT